jgi:hypothetical protein
MDCHPLLVGA